MNAELLSLIRETGYLSPAALTAQQRYDLLTRAFWDQAAVLGYNIPSLRRKLWVAAGRTEADLISILPEAEIQKAVKRQDKEQDPRKRIKQTAEAIALLYLTGEKQIKAAIDRNLEYPDQMRSETGRIRRELLMQAASWLGVAIPGLYVAGAKQNLVGPHARAAQAIATQEFNRFKEVDAQIGRHIEEVIAEAEKRRVQVSLTTSQKKVDYSGLRGRIIGHKTIDGKELGVSDYISMLAITAAREAYNLAVENRIRQDGNDLAMISREVRSNSCQSCRDWAGKTISITGKTKGYPTYDDARADNVFHPHCIHFLVNIEYEGST